MPRLVPSFLLGLVVLASPSLARAHDLWIVPPAACAVEAPCVVRLTQGMTFPDGEGPAPNTKHLAPKVLGPDGEAVPARFGKSDDLAATLVFEPEQPGLHTVLVDTTAKSITLDARAFNHYLVSDGMPQVYRARHESDTLDEDAVEQYQKFVKAAVHVGGPLEAGATLPRTGQRLEIVPLEPLSAARVGGTLPFRVLFGGQPLPEAHVGWSLPGRGDRPVGTVRTNPRGEAAVPLTQAGLTSLRLTHMERRPKSKPPWRSTWTTLTFRVPE